MISNKVLAAAGAVAMATGAAPQAHAQVPVEPVRVAIIDSGADKIDHEDAGVSFVNLTPRPPQGMVFADYKINDNYDHGDIVASAFMREFRKLDKTTPVVFYSINPFVRSPGEVTQRFNTGLVDAALPRLKADNVKVVITAFGISDAGAGNRFMQRFRGSDFAVFAAVPNDTDDHGIYPAASKGAISVASSRERGAYMEDRKMSGWVDFVANGFHGSAHNASDAAGTSFATPHVAAYGAYILNRRPEMKSAELKDAIASFGTKDPRRSPDGISHTVKVGLAPMVAAMASLQPQGQATATAVVASDNASPSPSTRKVSMMAMAAGGLGR